MTLNFKHFLIQHGVNIELFVKNCKPHNQRWIDKNSGYKTLVELSSHRPSDWLYDSFSFRYAIQKNITFGSLARKWELEVIKASTVVFGFQPHNTIHTRLP